MAADIQFKRSSVIGKVPDAANVAVGEPVVNLADKILFTKDGSGTVIVIGAGTTSNVAEGINLYFSNARVSTAVSTQTLTNVTFSGNVVAGNVITTGIVKSSGLYDNNNNRLRILDEGGNVVWGN